MDGDGKPYTLHLGDCIEALRAMPDNSVDSVVTDPPYGLSDHKPEEVVACLTAWLAGKPYQPKGRGFMGKSWDAWVPGPEVWREALRVLKPGGHLLAFAGTRSMDLMSMAVRLAGFEMRDSVGYAHDGGDPTQAPLLGWCFGSGFPKSLDVSKAIDKAAGAEREVVAVGERGAARPVIEDQSGGKAYRLGGDASITAPATDAARQWSGWGTALKPAWEPIILARKPLDGTVAANVLKHGTGALNIDGCRVEFSGDADKASAKPGGKATAKAGALAGKAQDGFVILGAVDDGEQLYWIHDFGWGAGRDQATVYYEWGSPKLYGETGREPAIQRKEFIAAQGTGRWPANLIHDGSEDVLAAFPDTGKSTGGTAKAGKFKNQYGEFAGDNPGASAGGFGDTGSAARFFYCAKASRADRNEGLPSGDKPAVSTGATMREREDADWQSRNGNHHPTVKPTDLMRYLCRLVTPPGGVVLDPFMGSGSTGKGAMLEGFRFVGCELSPDYIEIARARIGDAWARAEAAAAAQPAPQRDLFEGAAA